MCADGMTQRHVSCDFIVRGNRMTTVKEHWLWILAQLSDPKALACRFSSIFMANHGGSL